MESRGPRLRSSSAHCDQELVRRRGAEEEKEEKEEKEEEKARRASYLKI